jgi:hypothetical protein
MILVLFHINVSSCYLSSCIVYNHIVFNISKYVYSASFNCSIDVCV